MGKLARARPVPAAASALAFSTVTIVGWVVDVDPAGRARVDFPGNCAGPLGSRSLVRWTRPPWVGGATEPDVLLGFEGIDTSRPIILGLLHDSVLELPVPGDDASTGLQALVRVDGKRLEISAEEEIVLRCGRGSISLRADGLVVIKGSELTSRASGSNKIKGASVAIN